MSLGDAFAKLGNIHAQSLEGYTISEITEKKGEDIIKLTKDGREIGIIKGKLSDFTFYYEQDAGNAQDKVNAITGE